MIISDSTAHGGHAFHPAITKPPATDDNNGGDNTPIDPSAVQAVVASALTTASLTASSQFPTDTLSSCPLSSTLVDSLNPNLAMDVNPVPKTMSDHPLTVSAYHEYTSRSGLSLTLCPLLSSPLHPQHPQHPHIVPTILVQQHQRALP